MYFVPKEKESKKTSESRKSEAQRIRIKKTFSRKEREKKREATTKYKDDSIHYIQHGGGEIPPAPNPKPQTPNPKP